jgi:hypothetical protein
MTAIKNATSTSRNTFDAIQKTLVAHKARHITFSYADNGRIIGMEFVIEIGGTEYPFKLPARIENVEKIMYGRSTNLSATQREQAYRTAWANVRDWIAAQCALIDTGMVKPEEVFLPYLISNDGRTFYQVMTENRFLLTSGAGS